LDGFVAVVVRRKWEERASAIAEGERRVVVVVFVED
jgi:hypothetical protein